MSTYNLEQQKAADPSQSIWLRASAGTGKTKVLTDRLLRLLLKGTLPSKILCLTFTNAAANEMHERIYQKISSWAVVGDAELKSELRALGYTNLTSDDIKSAKNLLQGYLHKEESLNIHTIHSFCQKVLQKFPIEAGISPNFKIIDEINRPQIISHVKHFLIKDEKFLKEASLILTQMHESKLNELFAEIMGSQIKFKNFFAECTTLVKYQDHLKRTLDITHTNEEEIIEGICKKASEILGSRMEFEGLKKMCLTQDGSKKKRLSFQKKDKDTLFAIQDIVFQGLDQIKSLKIFHASSSFYSLAKMLIEGYDEYKRQRGVLDYDDLIYYTQNLFLNSEFKDWILYKLDGGIEHILVDEAQDTNLHQWYLIIALISDFIAGDTGDEREKSIFVVGDEKQSIYSFQGARYEYFAEVKQKIIQALSRAKKKNQMLNLKTSYRSSDIILETVNKIFRYVRSIDKELFDIDNFELDCHNQAYGGEVELWDTYLSDMQEELFWPVFSEEQEKCDPKNRLAKDIAKYIDELVKSQKVLFSTGKRICFSDFMILLRQRGELAQEIVSELKKLQIPVSGLDKMLLMDDLSVQDLLAAAKFTLFPDDELNLACLLRSPLFGLSEEELHKVTYGRKGKLHLHLESSYPKIQEKLDKIISLARNTNIADFFHILVYGYNNLENFITHNGYGAADSIGHLIGLAVKFEQEISSSLQEFISWCGSYEIEISKDLTSQNVVRIMTVHGAKGLQSPIVILPDTTSVPRTDHKFFWDQNDYPFFAINSSIHNAFYKDLKQTSTDLAYKEYLRLLYVATTRAQEQLLVCGYSTNSKTDLEAWHSIIFGAISNDMESLGEGKFICKSDKPLPDTIIPIPKTTALPLINLVTDKEYVVEKAGVNSEINSPLESSNALVYGELVHKILEDALQSGNIALLNSHNLFDLLPESYAKKMRNNLIQLQEDPEFSELLKSKLKVEIVIASSMDYNFGRIDLLVIKEDKVIIVDYKTDVKVPDSPDLIPIKYQEQLRNYKRMVQDIYPEKMVEAKLLWLSAPKFMLVD